MRAQCWITNHALAINGTNDKLCSSWSQSTHGCRCLDEVSGLQGKRISGLTGVWVDDKKVAAIGVRAQRWVTYHGLAINIANDLRPFQLITPCGIRERAVTCVKVAFPTL